MDFGYSNTNKAMEIIPEASKNDNKACNVDPTSGFMSSTRETREKREVPISTLDTVVGEEWIPYRKRRKCNKFFSEGGCPYGDMCAYLHDEPSEVRESVAITLTSLPLWENGANEKPSNWKTRLCNNWELNRFCRFGSKCHFAHGVAELHKNGEGLVENDSKEGALVATGCKQGGTPGRPLMGAIKSTAHEDDIYGMGSSAAINQRQGQIARRRWKGPDKISLIYGDWPYPLD